MNDDVYLRMSGVRFGYPRGPVFLGPVDVDLSPGQLLGVIGPNGAGKSTLLRLITGVLRSSDGAVTLGGRRIETFRPRERAKLIAFLPQQPQAPPDLVASEVVLLGRFPHRPYRFFDSADDHAFAERAMQVTDTLALRNRRLATLSVGEQQRVHLAAALTQQPRLLVLDEPTSALDPYYQLGIFATLGRLCRDQGLCVVVVTHDLNLAGRFADRLLLLRAGAVFACGSPGEVLRADILRRVYSVDFRIFESDDGRTSWALPIAQADRQEE